MHGFRVLSPAAPFAVSSDVERLDAIVIGLGAAGSAALAHLARRGVRTLGIEQFELGHAHGSSHGHTRLIRLCYHEHPDYVPLLLRAYSLWRELERDVGRRLLHVTGALYAGPPAGDLVGGSLRAAQTHGLAHELLDGPSIRARFPRFQLPPAHAGLFEPKAGYLLCEQAVAAHVEVALRHGARVETHSPVLRWSADATGVTVETAAATQRAAALVVTAGAWTSRLLPSLGWPLTVTRQALAWVWPRTPEAFAEGVFPCWAVENPGGGLHYGFPISPAGETGPGLKVALHAPGSTTDPDGVDRAVTADDEATVRGFLASHLPDADGPLLAMKTCLYTSTPDGHFVIDRHPGHANVVVASPCSGHGFKFAPVIGEVLADLVQHGRTAQPVEFLGAGRWRRS